MFFRIHKEIEKWINRVKRYYSGKYSIHIQVNCAVRTGVFGANASSEDTDQSMHSCRLFLAVTSSPCIFGYPNFIIFVLKMEQVNFTIHVSKTAGLEAN